MTTLTELKEKQRCFYCYAEIITPPDNSRCYAINQVCQTPEGYIYCSELCLQADRDNITHEEKSNEDETRW